jgi:hypothetical protein
LKRISPDPRTSSELHHGAAEDGDASDRLVPRESTRTPNPHGKTPNAIEAKLQQIKNLTLNLAFGTPAV